MKKTIQTNIGGFVFHIDEDAFEKLKAYLDTVNSHLKAEEGAEEIMQDIEQRIAEIFKDALKKSREVITHQDVKAMIDIMGRPEIIAEVSGETSGSKQKKTATTSGSKRLYRDPDNEILGGVCGGLGAYFGIDPIIFRLAFVLMFIAWGAGFLIYLLLWIVMPKARTTAEKLEMRGETINVSNIEKTVKEELEGVKQNIQNLKGTITTEKVSNTVKNFLNELARIMNRLLKIVGKFLAVFFIIIGIMFLSILMYAILFGKGVTFIKSHGTVEVPLSAMLNLVSGSFLETGMAIASAMLILGIPLIMLIYAGVKMLFRIRHKSRWINLSALSIWFVGIILGSITTVNILTNFTYSYADTLEKEIPLDREQTLWLKTDEIATTVVCEDFIHIGKTGRIVPVGEVKFNIVRNDKDSLCRLEITRFARGKTREEAGMNAKKIQYEVTQSDSLLIFSPLLLMTYVEKYRAQQVRVSLKIPDQQKIYIDKSMEPVLYDVDNVLQALDYDMGGHTWIMKKNGLDCIDCPPHIDNRHKFLEVATRY